MKRIRLGCLASGGGANLQAIIDAAASGELHADLAVVISNNSTSGALRRARNAGIPGFHLSGATHPEDAALDLAILGTLQDHGVDVVVLAGYMKMLGPAVLSRYEGRVLNVHPALLPKFGGKGMYGMRVHEAVLAAGESITGATVHVVDAEYDHGPVVAQSEVAVLPDDTVESVSARVLEREHELLVETLQKVASGEIDLGVFGASGEAAGPLTNCPFAPLSLSPQPTPGAPPIRGIADIPRESHPGLALSPPGDRDTSGSGIALAMRLGAVFGSSLMSSGVPRADSELRDTPFRCVCCSPECVHVREQQALELVLLNIGDHPPLVPMVAYSRLDSLIQMLLQLLNRPVSLTVKPIEVDK